MKCLVAPWRHCGLVRESGDAWQSCMLPGFCWTRLAVSLSGPRKSLRMIYPKRRIARTELVAQVAARVLVLVPVLVLVLVLAPGQATERALAPAMRRSLGPRLRTQAQTQLPSSSCRQKFANRALE